MNIQQSAQRWIKCQYHEDVCVWGDVFLSVNLQTLDLMLYSCKVWNDLICHWCTYINDNKVLSVYVSPYPIGHWQYAVLRPDRLQIWKSDILFFLLMQGKMPWNTWLNHSPVKHMVHTYILDKTDFSSHVLNMFWSFQTQIKTFWGRG